MIQQRLWLHQCLSLTNACDDKYRHPDGHTLDPAVVLTLLWNGSAQDCGQLRTMRGRRWWSKDQIAQAMQEKLRNECKIEQCF